jgi:hypothetical protein
LGFYPALDVESQLAADETTGLHFLLGYPIRRKAFNLDRARNVIKHQAYKCAQVRLPHQKDDEYHFSMVMPRGNVKSGKKKQAAAFPRGVSGGGVFLLDGPQPMLAGILVEYQRGERLVVTKATRYRRNAGSLKGGGRNWTRRFPSLTGFSRIDLKAPRKQRHTAHRIYNRLRIEKPDINLAQSAA